MIQKNSVKKNPFDTGAEIKRIRGEMSQQEFADLLDAGRTTIIRYESNERTPDAEFLFKLNLLFGVDPTRVVLGRDSVHIRDPKEMALLNHYRAAADADKRAIERMAGLAAQSAKSGKSKGGREKKDKDAAVEKSIKAEKKTAPKYTVDFGNAQIGQAIAGDVKNNNFKNNEFKNAKK